MASTYTVQNAADIVAAAHGSRHTENLHTPADLALAYMWNTWGWPQSLKELPPFWLVPGRMEYGPPFSAVPTDFAGLWEAHLAHLSGDGSGLFTECELKVLKNTSMRRERAVRVWPIESISYIPELTSFRLSSEVPDNIGPPEWMVVGSYKIQPTKITGANIGATLIPFDDKYFGAYVEMLRWKFMQLQGDPRAGGVQVVGSFRQYSGQAAVAHDAVLNAIMDDEDLGGSEQVVPDRVLTDW